MSSVRAIRRMDMEVQAVTKCLAARRWADVDNMQQTGTHTSRSRKLELEMCVATVKTVGPT